MSSSTYGLYQTHSKNIPKKNLVAKDKKWLLEKIKELDSEQKEALVMLICEHAKLNQTFDPNNFLNLPYDGFVENEGVSFDLGLMPFGLRWILFRFISQQFKH